MLSPLFEASLREAQAALACLTDEIDPPTADRLHFAEALLRHQAGREDAERYLAACCSPARNGPAPYQQLRAEKMPWLAEERQEEPTNRRLPQPLTGQISVDGTPEKNDYRANSPYVFQLVRGGRVEHPVYVRPGEPVPEYPKLRPVLGYIALGGILISGTGFLGADLTRQELDSQSWDAGELQSLRNLQLLNNTAFITGVGGGLVGLGAATWFAVTFR